MSDTPFQNLPARLPIAPPAPIIRHTLPSGGAGPVAKPLDTLTPAVMWRSVRQWWKIVLPLGLLLAAIGGAVVWVTFKPTYRTTAWLLIKEQPDYLAFRPESSTRFVQNQVELLRGPVVLERVLAKPEIARLEEVVQQAGPLEWLQKNIAAKNVGGSDIFELSFTGPDPAHVTTIINAVINSYLEVATQTAMEQTQRVIQLLTEEKDRRGKEVERLEGIVRALAKQVTGKDPFAPSGNPENLAPRSPLADVQARLVTTEVEREILQAQLTAMQESLSGPPREIAEEMLEQLVDTRPEITKLREDHEFNLQRLQEMERVAKPGFLPNLQHLKSQLKDDEQRQQELRAKLKAAIGKELLAGEFKRSKGIVEEIRQRVINLQLTEKSLKEHVDKLTEGQVQRSENTIELEFRKGELDRAERVYERIADRITALNTETRAPDRVTLLRKATVPTEAEIKSPLKMLSLVCLAIFALPFVLAIAWERHVRRILEPHQIVDEANLPVIGEIAMLPRRRIGPTGARQPTWSRHVFEESIDSLRTALVLSEPLKEMRVIAVVSAVSQEGKTSLSAQLAISLSRASGDPVLLVDADLRSPDLHNLFELPKEPGLVKALSNGTPVGSTIRPTAAHPLVHLLPAGRLYKSPHSLFGNGRWQSLVEQLRAEYRYVVIDTPPVLSASESLVVAKAADGTLICTLRESSRTGQVRQTYERLVNAGARVIGVVLSGVPTRTYAYKYGSYGYHKPVS